ncbi:hypothetical protein D3C77_329600 [compost metagenome]
MGRRIKDFVKASYGRGSFNFRRICLLWVPHANDRAARHLLGVRRALLAALNFHQFRGSPGLAADPTKRVRDAALIGAFGPGPTTLWADPPALPTGKTMPLSPLARG